MLTLAQVRGTFRHPQSSTSGSTLQLFFRNNNIKTISHGLGQQKNSKSVEEKVVLGTAYADNIVIWPSLDKSKDGLETTFWLSTALMPV